MIAVLQAHARHPPLPITPIHDPRRFRLTHSPRAPAPPAQKLPPTRRAAAREPGRAASAHHPLRAGNPLLHLRPRPPDRAAHHRLHAPAALLRALRRHRQVPAGHGGRLHPAHLAHRAQRSLESPPLHALRHALGRRRLGRAAAGLGHAHRPLPLPPPPPPLRLHPTTPPLHHPTTPGRLPLPRLVARPFPGRRNLRRTRLPPHRSHPPARALRGHPPVRKILGLPVYGGDLR